VGDNIIRRGKMAEMASTDPDVIGLRQYFKILSKNPRLDSTALQTVGSKGWDGFSMTLVS
jgi:predicted O-methyltransferase YrrM